MTKYVVFGKVDENGQYPFLDKRQKGYWIDKTLIGESPVYIAYQFDTANEARLAISMLSKLEVEENELRVYDLREE